MRTFSIFAIALSILSATSLLTLANADSIVYGLCSEKTDPNVYCLEQHNSRSYEQHNGDSVETTTNPTTGQEGENNLLFCKYIECSIARD
ncbi:MAG: hypothetical protein AB7V56_16645 [Candidatus Nitrosocosmicus sp.]